MRARSRRHGTTVTAVTLACALTCVARADARGDGYVTAGTGVYRNAFASGWLEQFSGGGEGPIAPHVDIGGDRSLVGGGGDVGGGFNYWFSENRAWVVEFRAIAPVVSS